MSEEKEKMLQEISEETLEQSFADDLFNRGQYARFIENLILKSDDYKRLDDHKSYSIALDAPWGTGKTFFLERFEDYIINKRKSGTDSSEDVYVVYYNAWENDFWDNAFHPLAYAILNGLLEVVRREEDSFIEKGIEKLSGISNSIIQLAPGLAKGVAKQFAHKVAGEAGKELAENILEGAEDVVYDELLFDKAERNEMNEYIQFKTTLENLTENIEDFMAEFGEGKKLLIIIDELDRCKPIFSIDTLEIVKHIFDVEDLVFLFGLDVSQLKKSVQSVYGDIDATDYLLRFFNYYSQLPSRDMKEYIRVRLENIDPLKELAKDQEGFMEHIVDHMTNLSKEFNLTLRDIDTITKTFNVMENQFLKDYRPVFAHCLYLTLLTMKFKDPEEYLKFIKTGKTIFFNKQINNNEYEYEYSKIINASYADLNKYGFKETHKIANEAFYKLITSNVDFNESKLSILIVDKYFSTNSTFGGYDLHGRDINIYKDGDSIDLFLFSNDNYSLEKNISISGILYYEDLKNWENIKHKTPREFLADELEMYNFTGNL